MAKAKYPMVLIRWDDSATINHTWTSFEDTMRNASDPFWIDTVAFLIKKADAYVVVTQSIDNQPSGATTVKGTMRIPTSAIKSMRKVR